MGTDEQLTLPQARTKREELKWCWRMVLDAAEQRNNKKREQFETLENTFSKFAAEWLELRKLENK